MERPEDGGTVHRGWSRELSILNEGPLEGFAWPDTQLTNPFLATAVDPNRSVLRRNSEPVPVLEFDPWLYSHGVTASFVLSAYCLSP